MRRFSRFVMVALVLVGVISVGCFDSGVDEEELVTLREEVRILREEVGILRTGVDAQAGSQDTTSIRVEELSGTVQDLSERYEWDREVLFERTSSILYLEWALEFPAGADGQLVDMGGMIGNRVYMAQQLQQNGDRSGARSVMLSVFPYFANTCGSVSPFWAYLLPEELRWTLEGSGFHLAPDEDLQQELDRQNDLKRISPDEFTRGEPDKEATDYFSIVMDERPGCR